MADIPRKDMAKHEQVECEEILIKCEFEAVGCDHAKVSKREELRVHQSNGLMIHLGLLLRFVLEMFGKVVKQVVSLSVEVKGLSQKFVSTQKTVAGLERRVEGLESSQGHVSSQGQSVTSTNGTLLWKIDDFNRRRREAVSGAQIATYSPHFYSSQFGYKMCAKIYMNGDGFGKNTHISLFFVVMNGEYDALLPWPFQKKITMMLLNQNNGEHVIDVFRSDPESSSFQQPTNNMNIAAGSPLFMPLNGLRYRGYVKYDTVFIKITVESDQYTDHLSSL